MVQNYRMAVRRDGCSRGEYTCNNQERQEEDPSRRLVILEFIDYPSCAGSSRQVWLLVIVWHPLGTSEPLRGERRSVRRIPGAPGGACKASALPLAARRPDSPR